MSDLAQRIAALSPEKRALLLHRAGQSHGQPPAALSSPSIAQERAPFPLTDIQQVYWAGRNGLFDLSGCGNNACFELIFSKVGVGFLERLERALQRVIARHDMLRAVVTSEGRQRILEEAPDFRLEIVDLRGRDADALATALAEIRQRLRYTRGTPERFPLFEVAAVFCDDEELRLHFRFDAIIVDGGSRNILFNEIFRLIENPDLELPPIPYSYREYASAAADESSTLRQSSRDFWFRKVPGLPPAAELPLARDLSPGLPVHIGTLYGRALESGQWAKLRAKAGREHVTVSLVLFAAFAQALAVWSRRQRFTISMEGTYRPPAPPGTEALVGNFNSLLLAEIDPSEGDFRTWLRGLQEQVMTALDHRHFSCVRVLREWRRRQARSSRAAMPIIFNSLIEFNQAFSTLRSERQEEKAGARYADAALYGTQILLLASIDQFTDGTLNLKMQSVDGVFPERMLEDLAKAFIRRLRALAEDEASWSLTWPEVVRSFIPPEHLLRREIDAARQSTGGDSPQDRHAAGAMSIEDLNRRLGVGAEDTFLVASSSSSSLTHCASAGASAAGATLVVPEGSAAESPTAWAELIDRRRVTVWISEPAQLDRLLHVTGRRPGGSGLGSLRLVLLGGDRIPVHLPDRLRQAAPGVRIFQLRGSEVNAVGYALREVTEEEPGEGRSLYGTPLAGQRLLLLNEALEPCPDWVAGEIYLGGEGLAEESSGDLLRHPRTGEWLRRTGDVARGLPSGEFEFLGREAESLVRVLGYPVEVHRVEACLESHSGVRMAVVVAVPHPPDHRLVAYLVGEPESEPELRARLAATFPYYMIPDRLLWIEGLPLRSDGRTDRRALAERPLPPHRSRVAGEVSAGLVRELTEIWEEVLGTRPIGRADDFFDLGGDSFLLVLMMNRVEERFGKGPPLVELFREPTVEFLSELLWKRKIGVDAVAPETAPVSRIQ